MSEKLTDDERECGFPCWCGAKNYDDAASKCDNNDDDSCCAQYMLENCLLPEDG